MKIEEIEITKLNPAPYNPRTITKEEFAGLKKSLATFGFVDPAIVNKDYTIIGGHQRVRAWQDLGYKTAPCIVLDLDKKQEKKLNVILNSHAISGKYDEIKLDEILEELKLDDDYLDLRLNELESLDLSNKEVEEDDFEPPKEAKYKVELGDVFQLGEHRLVCGDATKIEDVEKLMNGEKADMVFTDPPYGIDFQSNMRTKSAKFDVLKNDNVLLTDWIAPAITFSTGWILFCTTWKVLAEWLEIGKQIGKLSNMIIWDKGGGGIGDLEHSLLTDYEVILAYNRGNKICGKRLGSVWSIGKDGSMDYTHPTQKPVALPAQAIGTLSTGSVLDLFGGSGSTLIACEQLNRKCYMMELDPYYCSVIIERYEKLTGKEHKRLDKNEAEGK